MTWQSLCAWSANTCDYLSFQPLPLWLFFRSCLFLTVLKRASPFFLDKKEQKIKKEGMLSPTGHTPP